jgi:hypothetical protein
MGLIDGLATPFAPASAGPAEARPGLWSRRSRKVGATGHRQAAGLG